VNVVPGVGKWFSLFARGWGIDILKIKNPQIHGGREIAGKI
jgi:hypothetical protein